MSEIIYSTQLTGWNGEKEKYINKNMLILYIHYGINE